MTVATHAKPKAEAKPAAAPKAAKKTGRVKFTPARFDRINAHLIASDNSVTSAIVSIGELLRGREESGNPVVADLRATYEALAALPDLESFRLGIDAARRKFEDLL